jgi:DNA-binding transcriptional LysR family regulator
MKPNMDLRQLRCFVLAAEELHFGRAAQKLNMLPSAFGRFIRLLEEDIGAQLFARTTRNVALTDEGKQLLRDARKLLTHADEVQSRFREGARLKAKKLRVGAIDSAAVGLLPMLLNDFRKEYPGVELQLLEDKTIRLLPRVLSGRLDLAFVRPPRSRAPNLVYRHLSMRRLSSRSPQPIRWCGAESYPSRTSRSSRLSFLTDDPARTAMTLL